METADTNYALEVARYLLGSHPSKPHDPEILLEQLTTLFTGKPKELLRRMVHPAEGVLREADFVPSVAMCARWLEKRTAPQRSTLPEHRLLPPPKDDKPEDSQEVKDAAIERWLAKRRKVVASWLGEDSNLAITQHHDPEELLRALKNLEAHKQPNRQSA